MNLRSTSNDVVGRSFSSIAAICCHFLASSCTLPFWAHTVTDNNMGDSSSSSNYWVGFKDFLGEKFSFLDNYSKFIKRDKPLPSWSAADVETFIATDPVHGPALKTAREAAKFALTGSAIGAVSTAGVAWRYSRSLHGTGLAFVAGGVFGWTFGQEIANHSLQLYKFDTMAAQTKFLEWWEDKSERRS